MKNKTSDSRIKISLKPLAYIAGLITILIIVGSIANIFRTNEKVINLQNHGQAIYDAHSIEIQSLLRREENLVEITSTLKQINEPEKNLYQVRLVKKVDDNNWSMFDFNGYSSEKENLNKESIDAIKKYIETSQKGNITIQSNLSKIISKYPEQDYLVSVVPVKSDGFDIGYILISVYVNQNL